MQQGKQQPTCAAFDAPAPTGTLGTLVGPVRWASDLFKRQRNRAILQEVPTCEHAIQTSKASARKGVRVRVPPPVLK
jgi:hypothetical protein